MKTPVFHSPISNSPSVSSYTTGKSTAGKFVDKKLLRELEGWWLCERVTDEKTRKQVDVGAPIIFQLETILCQKGFFRIIGRVFNMTIKEIRIDNFEHGVVLDQNLRLYTNLKPPMVFADTDELIHELMETLITVKYDPDIQSIHLSNGKITAAAIRNPQGTGKYRQGLTDTNIIEIASRILRGDRSSVVSASQRPSSAASAPQRTLSAVSAPQRTLSAVSASPRTLSVATSKS